MSDGTIVCAGVRKSFHSAAEDLEILRGIDLELRAGDRASITGPSGCGKSTFLSILGGLDRPSGGEVRVGGVDLIGSGEEALSGFRSQVIGFVFQFHFLLKDFTALENVMLPAFMLHGDRKAAEEKARPLLEAVGLAGRMAHLPAKLSGGERQRVAIARALVNEPGIVLADEPTGNLDEANARGVEDLLFDMAERSGSTLLLVTHDPRLASRAERRFHLSEGTLFEL